MTRPLRAPVPADEHVLFLQQKLVEQGYGTPQLSVDGVFNDPTRATLELFQLQHIDSLGFPLKPDGVAGNKTWWAIENPSGDAQRNFLAPPPNDSLTPVRKALLDLIVSEHAKNIREVPDGSNRSPEIDKYWGPTGVVGQPWCCAFVSWALHEVLTRYPISGEHHLGVQNMWRAAKAAGLDTEAPCPGDLFIQILPEGNGHTGFVVGVSTDGGTIYTGEGNAGNRLKLGRRPRSTIHHFIDCLRDGQDAGFQKMADLAWDVVGGETR